MINPLFAMGMIVHILGRAWLSLTESTYQLEKSKEMDSLSSFARLHLYALNSECPQLQAIVAELSKELGCVGRLELPVFVHRPMAESSLIR
jgi:hypothetical protein